MAGIFGRRNGRRRRQFLWWTEGVLLATGAACLAWFVWNWTSGVLDESWSKYEFNASLRGEKPTVSGYVQEVLRRKSSPAPPSAAEAPEVPRPEHPQPEPEAEPPAPRIRTPLPNGELIGRIEIPRLKISAVVRHGVDNKTLKRAVGHVPQTALPGQPGNIGLAAHRDTHFRNLRGVKVGDTIQIVTSSGTYDYRVESTKVVWPKNIEVLDPTPEPAVTLVTCYPFNFVGSAPKRFIVRATQVGVTANSRVHQPAGRQDAKATSSGAGS